MSKLIKWWNDEIILGVMLILILTVLLSLLLCLMLPFPWNLITTILVCTLSGIVVKKLILKRINMWIDNE